MLAFTSAMSLAAAAAEQDGLYKADSPVTSLSSGVPAHNSSDQPFMLVEFYSAWCGHCQQFAPTYEELARVAKQRLPTLTVGAVNCPSHEDACGEHKVSSFPTILLFPGNHRYASHNRSVEGILAWVANQRTMQQLAAHAPATHGHLPVLGTEATRRLALDSLQGEAAAGTAAAAAAAASKTTFLHPRAVPTRAAAVPVQMGLFGLGYPELAVIGLVGIVLLGPERLVPMAKDLGSALQPSNTPSSLGVRVVYHAFALPAWRV
jgi:thiol-disulfide isomerase/thioredoxin